MQEKILNFDNLLKNVHLKISGNQETEKVLTKIEEKAKEEVFVVCESLSYKTKFPPKPVRKNKKGIEINTSGFKYRNAPHPNYDIIKRYISLGGKHITIGSDSHEYKNLGKHFNKIYNFLKKEKVKEITIYDKRKPKMIKI